MLNYSVHCLEEFSQYDLNRLHPEDSENLRTALNYLHKSVKFELPVNGSLFGDDFHKGYEVISTDLLHLPFPAVALEYPFEFFTGNILENFPSRKRIALCLDYETYKNTPLGITALKFVPRLAETGGIILVVFCTMDMHREEQWIVQPWGTVIPRFEPDGTNLSIFNYGKGANIKTAPIGFMAMPVMVNGCRKLIEQLGPDQAIANALRDANEEITALVGLLAALSCSNVKMHNESAPAKLNVKRVKNGKLPYYEYKTIVVDVQRSAKASGAESGTSVSGRQSPREHIRRGHIRRLSVGRNVWVQSAVIGAATKGRIDKVYKL